MNSYLFPDSIFIDNLYYGFTLLEFVSIIVAGIILMFATIYINLVFIALYSLIMLYSILNYKPSFNQSLYIEIKKRVNYHNQSKETVMNLGGGND